MKFRVEEVDRDYRTNTSSEIMEFTDQKAADKYCQDKTWTGYFYYAVPLNMDRA